MAKEFRFRRPEKLALSLDASLKPILEKYSYVEAQLLRQWPLIVGQEVSHKCFPRNVSFTGEYRKDGILHLDVNPAFALEIQHLEPAIIEKITRFLGYRAVSRIKLTQSTELWQKSEEGLKADKVKRKTSQNHETSIPLNRENIDDDELYETLKKLWLALDNENS